MRRIGRVRVLGHVGVPLCALALIVVACGDATSRSSNRATTSSTRSSSATSRPTTTTAVPTTTAPPATTTTAPAPPPPPDVYRRGAEGIAVEVIQGRLTELGFRPGPIDGRYGASTFAAVMAFQKHERLEADGHAGPITLAALGRGLTAPGPRGGPAPRIEVDVSRQIAFLITGDGATRIINVSSGNEQRYARPQGGTGVARTPRGSFEIERRIDGLREAPLGRMYRPLYFKGGFALHGSSNVPGYPASHGCVRTTNPDQDFVFETFANGTPVEVYDA
jgi:peptidoglycan hydrolase-like protein with peptidoglycan-binding domain